MFNITKKLGAAALIALFTMGSASATVLDTFDYGDDNFDLSYTTIAPVSDGDNFTIYDINVIGGDVMYTIDSIGRTGAATEILSTATGNLDISMRSGSSLVLELFYGDFNNQFAAPIDLTEAGMNTAFYFDVLFSDIGFDVSLDVAYFDGVGVSVDSYMSSTTSIAVPTRSYIGFDLFDFADFTQVVGVIVTLTSSQAADLQLAEFGVIPEPSTVAIFGLALVGFAFSSRRKAK